MPDSDAEWLALRLTPGLVANEFLYRRISSDLASIRRRHLEVRDVHFTPPSDGRTLFIRFDRDPFNPSFRAPDWDCANEYYRLKSVRPVTSDRLVVAAEFIPLYRLEVLADLYLPIDGVLSVGTTYALSPVPVTLCAAPAPDGTWWYLFAQPCDEAAEICPYLILNVDGNGTVSVVASAGENEIRSRGPTATRLMDCQWPVLP